MKNRVPFKTYLIEIAFLLIFASSLVLASQKAALSLESIQCPDYQGDKANKDILRGIHLLYDWRFNEAQSLFRKVIAEYPDKPIGYFYLAMVTWSHMASGFWSPVTIREYIERLDCTIDVAKSRIESNSADCYDFFYLGGALGFKGRYNLIKGEWLSAFFLATESVHALKAFLKMAPNNKDILLGLGLFDYYTARLSGVLKILSYLLIHRGNKQEGLRKLHVAAREGTYSATEAKNMLLHIYLFLEQDFSNALYLAKDLATRYDKNPRFKLLLGVNYICLDMDAQYRNTVDHLRQRSLQASSSKEASLWGKRALYLESIYDLFHGRNRGARSKLREILNQADPESDPAMIAWPLVKMGMSYNLEGNREEATRYYRQILNMENGSGVQFLAKKLLHKPPKEKDPYIGY